MRGHHLRLLLPLWLLRLACVLSPGYIHPDEFFQGPEVVAGRMYALDAAVPWEFDPAAHAHSPARTIVTPFVVSGLPYAAASLASRAATGRWPASPGPSVLLYAPRLFLWALSLVLVDGVAFRVCRANGIPPLPVLLTLASSWPALIFLARPFSNVAETLLLAACFWAVLGTRSSWGGDGVRTMVVGALLAAGVFTRFTFLLFFLPLGIVVIKDVLDRYLPGGANTGGPSISQDVRRGQAAEPAGRGPARPSAARALRPLAGALVRHAVCGLFGIAATVAAFVAADTAYFTATAAAWTGIDAGRIHGSAEGVFGGWIVTPLNSILYNMNPEHLALHGIHPRWLHAVVNLPMLFGPLAASFYLFVLLRPITVFWQRCSRRRGSGDRRTRGAHIDSASSATLLQELYDGAAGAAGCAAGGAPGDTKRATEADRRVRVYATCDACIVCGLGLLSAAPHQEPRFLLPLLLPLAIRYAPRSLPFWVNVNTGPASGSGDLSSASSSTKKKKPRGEDGNSRGDKTKGMLGVRGGRCRRLAPSVGLLAVGWVAFNTVLAIAFGLLHQGGITRALIHLHQQHRGAATAARSPLFNTSSGVVVTVVFTHTHTPPRFLLAQPLAMPAGERITVTDIAGAPRPTIFETLDRALSVQLPLAVPPTRAKAAGAREGGGDHSESRPGSKEGEGKRMGQGESADAAVLLVAPGSMRLSESCGVGHGGDTCKGLHLTVVESFWPHVSFEDPPTSMKLSEWSLQVYRVQRRRRRSSDNGGDGEGNGGGSGEVAAGGGEEGRASERVGAPTRREEL
jgi:phosphatidylinositol glycan class Z